MLGSRPGSPTPAQQDALIAAAKSGDRRRAVQPRGERPGSRRAGGCRETGIVAGVDFSPQKARIPLMLLLTTTSDVRPRYRPRSESDTRSGICSGVSYRP